MKNLFTEQTLIPFLEQFDFSLVLRADTPHYTVLVVSDQAEQLTGYRRADLVGRPLFDCFTESPFDPIGNESFRQVLDTVIGQRQTVTLPTYEQTNAAETAVIYVKKVLKPIINTDQDVAYVLVTTADVTQEIRAQQAAERSEQRLRTVIQQAPVAIALYRSRDMVVELANERMLALWNRSADVVGTRLVDVLPEAGSQEIMAMMEGVFDSGKPYYGAQFPALVWHDGRQEEGFFDLVCSPVRNAANEITSVLTVATDITRQVQAGRDVERSEQRLQGLINESPMAIAVYRGLEFEIELANEAMLTIWGKSPSVVGLPLHRALPELEGQPFLNQLTGVFTTGIAYHAWEAPATLAVDGKLIRSHFNFTYKPLFDETGQVYAILNVAINVEESVQNRQRLQESQDQYRQLAEQLEERVHQRTHELDTLNDALSRSNENLQQFAYVASHDLQEPLRKIQSFGDLLLESYEQQLGNGVEYLRRMQSAAGRMSTLIRELLNYSRINTTSHQRLNGQVSLGPLIDQLKDDLLVAIQESNARIVVDQLPTVSGDELQLRQLFQNLLSNAIKFRQPGVPPLIRITCGTITDAQLPAGVVPVSKAAQYYCIGVRDNGIGFDEKYLDRIFQVFQRLHTTSQYQGTGIGLAICEKVVTNHGGAIHADSKPGAGATFSIYLPVSDPRKLASVRL
ncbi:PAS domain-containing sensor histidine kinase [Spirosoma rhododendri]|uniref:histidine kinase n=1 Tax=Spirosoma rhododendri TaxID=2728024 RepID=A0A7L5DT64_9BACT|nr:ATP-binding protein [Spirosoma rhododendri]QJD80473.1 PAS domain-containing protein [Spirosoma rhododendri]